MRAYAHHLRSLCFFLDALRLGKLRISLTLLCSSGGSSSGLHTEADSRLSKQRAHACAQGHTSAALRAASASARAAASACFCAISSSSQMANSKPEPIPTRTQPQMRHNLLQTAEIGQLTIVTLRKRSAGIFLRKT